MPYAVTINSAVTSCCFVLEPDTSNVTELSDRSNDMSTLLTLMLASPPQLVNPSVLSMFVARTGERIDEAARRARDVAHMVGKGLY